MLDNNYEAFLEARAVALLGHIEAMGVPVSKVSEDSLSEDEPTEDEDDLV
jgi:hypothetical protein